MMGLARYEGTVLVVDDDPTNRELLRDVLEVEGHSVSEAEDGTSALAIAFEGGTDVILLDVMMPAPDGFEVCRRLKADPQTAAIPVLLVTALSDRRARLEGMRAGANDFLPKPIDTVDTVLRVRNAVRLKRLHDLTREQLSRMKELEALRDSLVDMLVHDLKSPLTSIIGFLKLLQGTAADRLSEREKDFVGRALVNSQGMLEMISSMLEVSRLETSQLNLVCREVVVENAVRRALESLGEEQSEVRLELAAEVPTLVADEDMLHRVLVNLLDNAFKHLPEEGGLVVVRTRPVGTRLRFEVQDNGRGIPPDGRDKLFQKFGQLGVAARYSTGLGLAFCRIAVEAHGGSIGVESELGAGATLWFELPTDPAR